MFPQITWYLNILLMYNLYSGEKRFSNKYEILHRLTHLCPYCSL